ncbi:hypothetical protein C7S18_09805 [Ahniella affigens]|uniref:Response regulatory domain-containing protein n=1 Tax=Ahniella affigens TaxID=2021234 RepID=A0A2P1PRL9_9GAMM|nr:response regulator [Ahniella affigens]AVP97472.1 hypothetical protein C7S18_09805 [Ahniella affigens]
MTDPIRILCLGFARPELRLINLAMEAAAHTLPRGFQIVNAAQPADVVIVNWSTLNIERTQAFLVQRVPELPLISVSETGVLGQPGLCTNEDLMLQSLPALVYEAIQGIEPAARAKPPEYVSWLSVRRTWVDGSGDPELSTNVALEIRGRITAEQRAVTEGSEPPRVRAAPPPIPGDQVETGQRKTPRVAPPAPATRAAAAQPPPLPLQPLSQVRVALLAEARPDLAQNVANLRQLGAEVTLFGKEKELHEVFKNKRVDLVLIDARMPDEAGYKACRALSHHPARGRVPLIMVANDLRPIERARAAYAGSQGLVCWPITDTQVIERVHPIVTRAEASRDPAPSP